MIQIAISFMAGILGFALVAVGATAGFESRTAFSLMIGLLMGVYADLTALFATYVGLTLFLFTRRPVQSRLLPGSR